MTKVLVTGGSGFVGKNLECFCPNWTFVSRKDANLLSLDETLYMFEREKPDIIIHLASVVGGLFYNTRNNIDIMEQNVLLNTNVIKACRKFNVTKGIFVLSTCIYPDNLAQTSSNDNPMTIDQIHNGPPHPSNQGYAISKRVLDIMCSMSNDTYGTHFIRLCPSNLYGPRDQFDKEKSHVVPALVRKIAEHKKGPNIIIQGSASTQRQFLYVGDLCHIIKKMVVDWDMYKPIVYNIAPKEVTIGELVSCILESNREKKDGLKISWTMDNIGQPRKTCKNDIKIPFTSLYSGINETVIYYNGLKKLDTV